MRKRMIVVLALGGVCLATGAYFAGDWGVRQRVAYCERQFADRHSGPPSSLFARPLDRSYAAIRERAKAERRERDREKAERDAALAEDRPELNDLDQVQRSVQIYGEVEERRRLKAEQAKRDRFFYQAAETHYRKEEVDKCFWGRGRAEASRK